MAHCWDGPCFQRKPLKKLDSEPDSVLSLRHWRSEAIQAGREVQRIVVAYEAGRPAKSPTCAPDRFAPSSRDPNTVAVNSLTQDRGHVRGGALLQRNTSEGNGGDEQLRLGAGDSRLEMLGALATLPSEAAFMHKRAAWLGRSMDEFQSTCRGRPRPETHPIKPRLGARLRPEGCVRPRSFIPADRRLCAYSARKRPFAAIAGDNSRRTAHLPRLRLRMVIERSRIKVPPAEGKHGMGLRAAAPTKHCFATTVEE